MRRNNTDRSQIIKVQANFSPIPIPRRHYIAAKWRPAILAARPVVTDELVAIKRLKIKEAKIRIPVEHTELTIPPFAPLSRPKSFVKIEIREIETVSIRPGEREKAEQTLIRYFRKFEGEVRALLAYIDETTFKYIDQIPKNLGVKLLISATGGRRNKIASLAAIQRRERPFFDVTEITFIKDGKEKPLLHERWISDDKILIDIGTDLKRSSLGAKQHSIIIYDVQSFRKRLETFEFYWSKDDEELSKMLGYKVIKRKF